MKDFTCAGFKDLAKCNKKTEEYTRLLEENREKKKVILENIRQAYADKLQGQYFKTEKDGKIAIGKVEDILCKNGIFYIHASIVNITVNSKVVLQKYNFPLTEENINNTSILTEDEYKLVFFDYVNKSIKVIPEIQ